MERQTFDTTKNRRWSKVTAKALLILLIVVGVCALGVSGCRKKGNETAVLPVPEFHSDSLPYAKRVELTLPEYESVIAVCSVTDFGAGKTEDDTKAFQDALAYAANLGGGSVFVPAGVYSVSQVLSIPNSVTLIGQSDTRQHATVIEARVAESETRPFLSIGTGAALIGITVYYPEQDFENVRAYAPTLYAADGAGGNSGYATVKYVTLVNPYIGASYGPEWNELGVMDHVTMTPLHLGIFVNMTTDVGRFMDVQISADAYVQFMQQQGETVDATALKEYLQASVTGVVLERSDWHYFYKLRIADVHTAMRLQRQSVGALGAVDSANCQIYDMEIANCVYGMDVLYNAMSTTITRFSIHTQQEAIRLQSGFSGGFSLVYGEISSAESYAVHAQAGSRGAISLVDSTLSAPSYLFMVEGGGLMLENCRADRALAGKFDVGATGGMVRALQNITVESVNPDCMVYGAGEYQAVTQADYAWQREAALQTVAGSAYVINVLDAGADATGERDNTKIFQDCLQTATRYGGGTVFVPAGKYRVDGCLTIPEKVVLRGVSETGHHTNAGGTILLTTQGKYAGTADNPGEPFIRMSKASGLRGLTVWHAEQQMGDYLEYPYTVYVDAEDVQLQYLTLSNGYKGVYLGNAGGHYLSFVTGFNMKHDVYVDGSARAGRIENCHFNPHFYFRVGTSGLVIRDETDFISQFLPLGNMKKEASIVLGETKGEVLFNNFNYNGAAGLLLKDSGKGFDGYIIGNGFDGNSVGLIVERAANVTFVNFTTDLARPYLYDDFAKIQNGTVRMINSCFGAFGYRPDNGIQVTSGSLQLRGLILNNSAATGALQATNGSITASGVIGRHKGSIVDNAFTVQSPDEVVDAQGNVQIQSGLFYQFFMPSEAANVGIY